MSHVLLSVKDLRVIFGQGATAFTAVKDVSFDLYAGETLAIVGESGSGKSVTALSLLKLLPPPPETSVSGHVVYKGQDLMGVPASVIQRIRGKQIAMIFQEPMTALNPLHTVEKQIGEMLVIHKGLSFSQARAQVLELLFLVNFKDPEGFLERFPHQLSGGQRQRVMIAMALACEPEILLADEPTTALDVTTQAEILKLLKMVQKKFSMTLVMISHDLTMVKAMADRVLVMKEGGIQEMGSKDQIFGAPQAPYTRYLLSSEPQGRPGDLLPQAKTLLKVQDLSVHFPITRGIFQRQIGIIKAIHKISFTLKEGETLGIVGESGSGKTTLALALLKLIKSRGELVFQGHNLQNLSKHKVRPFRRHIQIVFQDPFASLNPRLTVEDILEEGLKVHSAATPWHQRKVLVQKALEEVGLSGEYGGRYPHEFSGGQRQRIAIARALILKPQVVLLDEPTSALDRTVQKDVLELLRNLQKMHGLSYLFISHDLKVVKAMSHHVLIIKNGEVVESGATEKLFSTPRHAYTQELLKASLAFDF